MGILALEDYVAVARTDVERLLIVKFKGFVASLHYARATYVEHTDLAASGEERCLQGVDGLELERLVHGHGTAHYHTVVHRVHHVYLIGCKHLFNEEVATDTLGVVALRILRMCCITHFIVCLHSFTFVMIGNKVFIVSLQSYKKISIIGQKASLFYTKAILTRLPDRPNR